MESQTSKIVLAVIITAVVVGGGVYAWQNGLFSDMTSKQVESSNAGTTYTADAYQITYPNGWTHKNASEGNNLFFKGSVPSDTQLWTSSQTSLTITQPSAASDQGMCLLKTSERSLTTKNGLTFVLTSHKNDKNGEICADAFDHDFIQVKIGNSLNKTMTFTHLPTDTQAEKDLENLLQSIQVK